MFSSANIFLIGPMGAGKSTIGRLVAKLIGVGFHDTDKEIEKKTGVSIPMIFEYEGESGFRRREADVIDELVKTNGVVLATGGGSILLAENQSALKAHGFIVYLHCSIDKQLERTFKDTNRPLLNTEDPKKRLEELFAVREPLYRSLADLIIDTGQHSSKSAARLIVKAFYNENNGEQDFS